METSTLRSEDHFESFVQENYALMENLHEQCYTKCTTRPDLAYLTLKENTCFRNCINKFNNWYGKFEQHTRDAAFKTYWNLTEELEADLKKQ